MASIFFNITSKVKLVLIAFLVPTIVFIIIFLGIKYIPLDGNEIEDNNFITAQKEILPYLSFDSIKSVKDSAFTEYYKKKNIYYFVRLDGVFPESSLKGLRAYTQGTGWIGYGDVFCCDEFGVIPADSIRIYKRQTNGNFYLVSTFMGKTDFLVKLGKPSLRPDDEFSLFHDLAYNENLVKTIIIVCVSFLLIGISCGIKEIKQPSENISDVCSWIYPLVLLLIPIGYGIANFFGFLEYKHFYLIAILMCWGICVYSWACNLLDLQKTLKNEEDEKIKEKEEKEKNERLQIKKEEEEKQRAEKLAAVRAQRMQNGVDPEFLYGCWYEANSYEHCLIFNENGTAIYTKNSDSEDFEIYKYEINQDKSVILNREGKKLFLEYWPFDCFYLNGIEFSKSGKDYDTLQEEFYKEQEERRKLRQEQELQRQIKERAIEENKKIEKHNIAIANRTADKILGKDSRNNPKWWILLGLFIVGIALALCCFISDWGLLLKIVLGIVGLVFMYLSIFNSYIKYQFHKRGMVISLYLQVANDLDEIDAIEYVKTYFKTRKKNRISVDEYKELKNKKNEIMSKNMACD